MIDRAEITGSQSLLSAREYVIKVCPGCGAGPLLFDPDGLDAAEGMMARAHCECGRCVIITEAFPLRVVAA